MTKEEEETLLQSLAFDQIDDRHNTIEIALADTCQWLLETASFRDWLDPEMLDEHHGFLWIKGKPGAGKSTLMKFALQNSQEAKRSNIIFFFFNARGDDLEKSTAGMYRSLLLQLFERLPRLRHVLNCFRLTMKNGSIPRWTTQHLKSLFSQALHDLGESPLMMFIDALDECDEDQIRDMVAFLQDTAGKARQKRIMLQICFASRYYPKITIEKGIHLDIGSQKGHDQDIMIYVKRKLQIGQDNLARKIHATLIEKASGVFLWVFLVVRILQKVFDKGNRHELEDRLQTTPKDLEALFHDILTRDDCRQNELLWCIQWILFARHPLSPSQLREAVLCGAAPNQARAWLRESIDDGEIKRFVIDCSKGLAEFTKSKRNPTVQFIHESVRGFLLEDGRLQKLWPDVPNNLKGQSQERLKQCCLDYCCLSLNDVFLESLVGKESASKVKRPRRAATQTKGPHQSATRSSPRRLDPERKRNRQLALEVFPLLEYAVRNVLHHADAAEGAGVDQGQFLASFPLSDWIKLENVIAQYVNRQHGENASLLYILSEYNAPNLIKCYPNNLSGFKKENERYGLPILAALATGSREAVLALMEAHADSEPQNHILHDICRQYACSRDDESQSFQHLSQFLKSESVFYNLLRGGDEFIVDFALTSALCDPAGVEGTLLELTTSDTAIARVLLKHNSTLALLYKDITKLKVWAASHGFTDILQELLDRAGTTETPELGNDTLLLAAARAGRTGVVQLLLERKTPVEAKDSGGTSLSGAIEGGHEAAMQILLENGARLENASIGGKPPLCWAAGFRRESTVQLLIDNGANVEAADRNGKTPLSWAAAHGKEATVQLLIDSGANIEAADGNGRTPLFWAVEHWSKNIAQLLLNNGANIEAADMNGQTPLSWAAAYSDEATVQLLIDSGANIEAADGNGQTPLFWAVEHWSKKIPLLLLNNGANVEAADRNGQTPLSGAAAHWNEATVQLLIDSGANIEAADKRG